MRKTTFFLLTLICVLFSASAFCEPDGYEVYNNGEFTGITNVLVVDSDKEYIEIKDLPKLNMEYNDIKDGGFRISNGGKSVDIYAYEPVDIGSYTFENPVIIVDDIYYIWIDIIGKCFSSGYGGSLRDGIWKIYLDVEGEPESPIPADGVQAEGILCDYANDVFVIHLRNQYDYKYSNVQIFVGYYDKSGRLIDATVRNQYSIAENEGEMVILPIEECMDNADSIKIMLWTGGGMPSAENTVIKDFKFNRELAFPDEKEQIFLDVPAEYDYYDAIYLMNKQDMGCFNGYDDGNYYPEDKVMRSEFAYVLSELLGMEFENVDVDGSFCDVPKKYWCEKMASFAVAKEYMVVTKNGEFLPEEYITKNDVLYTFLKALGEDVKPGEKHTNKAVDRNLFKGGVVTGYYVTRGELAHLAYNFMMEYTKTE